MEMYSENHVFLWVWTQMVVLIAAYILFGKHLELLMIENLMAPEMELIANEEY